FGFTNLGRGWLGGPDGQEYNGGEILVHPVPVGFFWRPTRSVSIRAELSPGPQELKRPEGQSYWRNPGQMYARFSPDRVHWSTWQALSLASRTNRVFEGLLAVPGKDAANYQRLRLDYANREGIPWSSDEEAAVRWILEQDPAFFANNLPFIGYVQLLFEGEFVAGHRFKNLKAELSYSVGGLHAEPPKDERIEKQMWTVPWRFQGSTTQAEPGGSANGSPPSRPATNSTPSQQLPRQ
ncbi:MAG: hypothetical protein KIT22_04385, partial [Verrucomicrobiae bacterium]|nr:hypothetical protein [Verrucomicrobiae bacterium]